MDSGGRDPPASDQSQKELSISLAASSMINGSDVITQEAYQANLKRIQEVKEMVRRLEMNNESAHNNFLEQLEKRVKDGREAQDVLARLRNQPLPPETVQFTSNVPSDRLEVILPTTATLVEVPESHSHPSRSSPTPPPTSHPPQTIQQGRPAKYQWNLLPQVHQVQPSFNPDVFRYYQPPLVVRQPSQYSAAPLPQAPANPGQMGRSTTQNVPPQTRAHNPLAHQTDFQLTQVQQPTQSWSSYPHQVIALPPLDTVPATGYYTPPAGWVRMAPAHTGSSTVSSNSTYGEPNFPMQSTAPRLPVPTHHQPQSPSSLASTYQVQAPLQGVPAGSVKTPSGQLPPIQSHSKPAASQLQSVSATVSTPVAVSELQRPHRPLQQLQQHQSQPQQPRSHPQRHPQPPLQPQQHSQYPQPHPQQLPQPLLQPQQYSQQSEAQLLSRPPLQLPQTPSQVPPQSTDRILYASASRPQNQPSQGRDSLPVDASPRVSQTQLSQPTTMQEQARQRGPQPRLDQAMFIKLFQMAIQSGASRFETFWVHAKASRISDEWFNAAINSLPPDVRHSVMTRVNQSEPTHGAPPPGNAPQQQVSTITGPNVPVVSAPLPLTATLPVQLVPATEQGPKSSTSVEGRIIHPASEQTSGLYTAQLQYYAAQATKSALSATQAADISTTPLTNITTMHTTAATPKRDGPQARANVRTPRDANKSALARDILRSLGKTLPKIHQETGGMPTEKANDRGDHQLAEVTPSQSVSRVVSPKPPAALPATSFVESNPPSMPSAKPNVPGEPQRVTSPNTSTAKSILKEAHGQAAIVEGPIMIDLTLEDSDESVDGKGQDPTFPIQTSSAATSSRPVSPMNTTNHTPLLENLSLEEPLVNTVANDGNADVRMDSPSLSLVAEENMEPKPLYPSFGSTELVPPGSEQLPREASEHPVDGQLPLFLPSPPASPVHIDPPKMDLEKINDEGESRSSLKRHSVDIGVMEFDTKLVTLPRVRKRRKQQVYVLIPPAPLYVKKGIKKTKGRAMREDIDADLEGVGEDEELRYSHLEQLLIEESKLRLLERRCRWLNCGVILNCAANLLAHLKIHAHEEDLQAPFLCRWAGCQRQFNVERERDVHLERHTTRPLPCPFSGCHEQFDKPVEVMQHEMQHQKADHKEPLIRKPTCQPIVPAIPSRLGSPPRWLPSHCVIPRRVVKCRISADRHAIMGPWVFWNIFSQIELNMRKQNASMRGRPTRQSINYDTDNSDPRRDDYDFLLALSSYPAKNLQLDDLDSTLITMSAARGLTLWGSGSSVNDAARSATPEEHVNVGSVVVDAAVPSCATEETRGRSKVAEGDEEQQSGQSLVMGEEGDVERMLIL